MSGEVKVACVQIHGSYVGQVIYTKPMLLANEQTISLMQRQMTIFVLLYSMYFYLLHCISQYYQGAIPRCQEGDTISVQISI